MHYSVRASIALLFAVVITLMSTGLVYNVFYELRIFRDGDILVALMWGGVAPLLFVIFYCIAPRIFEWKGAGSGTHCRRCGYNLTGNVSGVCPECGERI